MELIPTFIGKYRLPYMDRIISVQFVQQLGKVVVEISSK